MRGASNTRTKNHFVEYSQKIVSPLHHSSHFHLHRRSHQTLSLCRTLINVFLQTDVIVTYRIIQSRIKTTKKKVEYTRGRGDISLLVCQSRSLRAHIKVNTMCEIVKHFAVRRHCRHMQNGINIVVFARSLSAVWRIEMVCSLRDTISKERTTGNGTLIVILP